MDDAKSTLRIWCRIFLVIIMTPIGVAGASEQGEAGLGKDFAACKSGDIDACFRAAEGYYTYAETPDVQKGREAYAIACENGNMPACFNAGVLYAQNKDDNIDKIIAIHFLAQACDAAIADACFEFGKVNLEGQHEGNEKIVLAQKGFVKACQLGNAYGCLLAGQLYDDGYGEGDVEEAALNLYLQACHMDSGQGCYEAASRYFSGDRAPKNEKLGLMMFGTACDYGFGAACHVLGMIVDGGVELHTGMPAKAYYQAACNDGVEDSCKKLEELQP